MPCYHPLIATPSGRKRTAKDGHKYFQMQIFNPEEFELEQNDKYDQEYHFLIPCRQCIGCRLEYSREWANRGYLESKLWDQNWFATLTYDEEHIPYKDEVVTSNEITFTDDGSWNGTLNPKHLTQFLKNLRQIMKREYDEDNIRFMACGEYGGETERPHYHIILFNLNLPVEDLYNPRLINHEVYYQSHIIERAWGKGICNISEATWNTIAYTARYITKKINGEISEDLYASKGQEREFLRTSRMPGIGEGYYRKHWEEIYEKDEIIIKNKSGVISSKPPKYFDRLFEEEHPEEFEKIKKKRRERATIEQQLKDKTTSVSRKVQAEIEEREKDEHTVRLIRAMETQW